MRVITEKLSAAFSLRAASARGQKPTHARNPLSFLLIAAFLIIGVFSAAPAQAQIFDGDGGSGSGWIQMLRGNYSKSWTCVIGFFCNGTDDAPIADPGASQNYMAALRIALGVYSNGVLIVASIILLYHLLVMTGETAHSGVAGGKRANQIWAPIRLVLAIGLLVPLSGNVGLNSGQYITLQIIEWGSNMASNVWRTFLSHAGTGSGTDPTPHMPDTGAIAREAAKIGACMGIINSQATEDADKIKMRSYGPAILWGNEKSESLCGSVIIFSAGAGAAAGLADIQRIIDEVSTYYVYFLNGYPQSSTKPPEPPSMILSFALGTLESVSGGWNTGAGSAGSGWVGAGSYFLDLAAGGSNRVSGTDTLPIIMGPQAEKIRPDNLQNAFFKMAEWVVGKYKSHLSGGGADTDMMGNTVAGRKFVDLMLLLLDQMGVISGLWSPGSAAFVINLNNSPLAELVDLGHRMIRTALDFVGTAVELGVNGPQHAMYSAQVDASTGKRSFGPQSGMLFVSMALPILGAAAGSLLTMGIWIGIFTPLLPFVKFALSVLTWLVSVVETMVCVPLLALAYLTPYGDGFGGQKVEPGYYLIMHAFLRPVMTIFGLIASILLFNIIAHLVTTFYLSITQNAGTFQGGMYVVTKIAFGMMYVAVMYLCLNSALKVMDTFGKHATRWLGGQSHEEFMGDGQQAVSMAQQGTQMFQSLSMMGQYGMQSSSQLANQFANNGAGATNRGGPAIPTAPGGATPTPLGGPQQGGGSPGN